MKTIIILDDNDIKQYVRQMLEVKGLAAVNDIELKPIKSKGEPTRYEITLTCEPIALPAQCPLCDHALQGEAQEAPAPATVPTRTAMRRPPREFRPDGTNGAALTQNTEEDLGPVSIDPELGETTEVPPEIARGGTPDVVVVDGEEGTVEDGEFVPSIASLVGTNERLRAQRERELAEQRKHSPKMMAGESTRPPKPGS